jgi:hypothetical protein
MKYINKIVQTGLLCCIIGFTGCEIEDVHYDRISPDTYPSNYKEADAMLLGSMYEGFSPIYILNSFQGWCGRNVLVADEFEANHSGTYIGFDMINANNPDLGIGGYPITDEDTDWNYPLYMYANYLSKMELTMDRIKNVPMSETEKRLLNAQLHCGMGWLGFMEYDLYGPIPIPSLEILRHPALDEAVPRATEEQMRNYIEQHLLAALGESTEYPNTYIASGTYADPKEVGLLPYAWDNMNYGRFTRGLAQMVLMEYYMTIGEYGKAAARGRELVNNEGKYGYALVSDYNSLFNEATEKNTEVIFSNICTLAPAWPNTLPNAALPSDYPTPGVSITKSNMNKLTWWFYDTFETDDTIRTERIITEYTGTSGIVHNRANDTQFDRHNTDKGTLFLGALPSKIDWHSSAGMYSSVDVPIYRYAGALTMLAEAIVRGGGAVSEALPLVNRVRTRAKLKNLEDVFDVSTTNKFLERLLWERAHELWHEGHHRRDQIRHGDYIQHCMDKARRAGLPEDRIQKMEKQTVSGKYDYEKFPIPVRSIIEGKGVVVQNPGY